MSYYLEEPSLERCNDAMQFLNEFDLYNSEIHGVGGLDRYRNDYQGWLDRLDYVRNVEPSEDLVPALTYFMVEEETNQIVGMVNIRLNINERLRRFGGHIGYSIRPTRRREGLAHIQLYLALEVLNSYGIYEAYLGAADANIGSNRTILALGGELLYTDIDEYDNELSNAYVINVRNSLNNYRDLYGQNNFLNR